MNDRTALLLFLLVCFLGLEANAQREYVFPAVVEKKIRLYEGDPNTTGGARELVNEGELLHLVGTNSNLRGGYYRALWKDKTYWMDLKDFSNLRFETERLNHAELWHLEFIKSSAYEEVSKYGWSYNIREELELEYASFYETLERYDDPILADYVNRALLKIAPIDVAYQHPALLRVHIFNAPLPCSYSCVNGDIYLSSGLLASLHSVEELYAFLATEVAHVYFDHGVSNFRAMQRALNRAAFWSSVVTLSAAVLEASAMYESGTYFGDYPGQFTEGVGNLSTAIAFSIASRLGMDYTLDQRKEADKAVDALLRNQALNPKVLPVAMKRINTYNRLRREYLLKQRQEFYPNMYQRFEKISAIPDEELEQFDHHYVRQTALVRNAVAWQAFHGRDYQIAQRHLDLQFRAGVAILEDYLLQSVLLRQLSVEKTAMERALSVLQDAERRSFSLSGEFFLEKALVLIRLDRKAEAIQALEFYQEAISGREDQVSVNRRWWVVQTLEQMRRG